MIKKHRISLTRAIRNITTVAQQAGREDWKAGAEWYWQAREEVTELARYGGISLQCACHIVAALSPGIRWESNIKAARLILQGPLASEQMIGYPSNVGKARDILRAYREDSPAWSDILTGPKVTAFAETLFNPDTEHSDVVLDVHAISIAFGKRFTVKTTPDLRQEERRRLDKAYRVVAKRYNVRPHQIQAVTWVAWRRIIAE
jgi:hypothetical protein